MGTTRSRAVQTSAGPVRIRVGVVEDAPVLLEHRRHMAMTSVHNVMTLDEMETARALYEDLGFVEVPPYYHNPIPGAHYLKAKL